MRCPRYYAGREPELYCKPSCKGWEIEGGRSGEGEEDGRTGGEGEGTRNGE